MASVLYMSYTGLSEPLGESQVFQYLMHLAHGHRITLITFEKPENIGKPGVRQRLKDRCTDAGIDWVPLTYHRRPGIPATVYDILQGTFTGWRKVRAARAEIIHARSYIAGTMALLIKRLTGVRFVFDMRGFWPDERVDGGIWTRNSLVYRLFKRVERRLFLGADHVVSLTKAGAKAFADFPYLKSRVPPTTVIPTCTNLGNFKPQPGTAGHPFTFGYLGSAGTWYMFPEVVRAVKILFDLVPDSRFIVVNRNEHDYVRACLERGGIDLARVEIAAASYQEVPGYLARMSAGIFFIKPMFSKLASCPTRMGEFLGSGLPCLANAGVGDVEGDLAETGTGIAISAFDDETLRDAIMRLIAITKEPGIAAKCRRAAEERFSLESGVKRYDAIYRSLADGAH